jgi:hypothetical protein
MLYIVTVQRTQVINTPTATQLTSTLIAVQLTTEVCRLAGNVGVGLLFATLFVQDNEKLEKSYSQGGQDHLVVKIHSPSPWTVTVNCATLCMSFCAA